MDENFTQHFGKMFGSPGEVQEKLERAQKELAGVKVTGAAGGDMVTVVVSGERKVLKVNISEEALQDSSMLADLIVAATNDGLRKAEKAISEKMQSSLLGGMLKP